LKLEISNLKRVKRGGGTPAVRKERERDWGKQGNCGGFWVGAQAEAYATETHRRGGQANLKLKI
jgi:hypothetical protein